MNFAATLPLLRWLPPLLAVTLALLHGPALIDDAFITFRYSENLAAGHGLVFNPGEWVLGTSSPLMALLVAGGIALGFSAPQAALVLSVAAIALLVLVIEQLARESLPPMAAWTVALACAVHPSLAYVANSGMETALSMTAVYAALALALRGHGRGAGLAAGVAALLRPDGVVVIALLLAWSARRARQQFAAIAVFASLLVVPAALAAWHFYGGLAPHSVAAKQLIHADSPQHILQGVWHYLSGLPVLAVIVALAALGALALLRARSSLWLIPAWLLLQVAGLASARIQPIFPWYFCPLHPGLILLAAVGVAALGARHGPRVVPAVMAALAVGLLVSTVPFNQRFGDPDMVRRTNIYLELGRHLASSTPAGAPVFVGEVGALAWAMPAQRMIDSAGINSPAVFDARREDHERLRAAGERGYLREGSPAWVREVIANAQPVLIVTFAPWLHIDTLANEADFSARYAAVPWPQAPALRVYRRREATALPP